MHHLFNFLLICLISYFHHLQLIVFKHGYFGQPILPLPNEKDNTEFSHHVRWLY